MTIVVSYPDATTANTGALTGGATAHAVLGDVLNDSTYVTFDTGEGATVTFPDVTVPAGAVVKSNSLAVRAALSSGFLAQLNTLLGVAPGGADGTRILVDSSIVQWYSAVLTGAYDPDLAIAAMSSSYAGASKVTSLALLTTYVAKPTLDVTAPTGTLTEDNRPTVTWTNTLDADGGPQVSAQVKVFNSTQYGAGGFDPATSAPFDTGAFLGSATSFRGNVALPNDSYRAYVQTTQSWGGGTDQQISSDWTYEAFTVDIPVPLAPSLIVTPEPDAIPAPRMRLDIAAGVGGAVTTDAVEIEHKVDGTWVALRTVDGDGREETVPATIYDFEAPNDAAQEYRVRAVHSYTDSETFSPWTTATGTMTASRWAIHHPTAPQYSLTVDLRSFPGHDRAARQSVKQPLGRSDAVVISDTRGPQSGQIVIRLSDDATRDAVMRLADAAVPLLFTPPSTHHEPQRWLLLGDETVERLVDNANFDERNASYAWTEVANPSGDITAWPDDSYPSSEFYPDTTVYPTG